MPVSEYVGHAGVAVGRVGRRRNRLVGRSLLAVGSLVFMCGAVELALRLVLPPASSAALPHVLLSDESEARLQWLERHARGESSRYAFDEPDPLLGWRVKPNADVRAQKPGSYDVVVHTNNQGLRGREPVSVTPTSGRMRIGLFGCSQTFGEGVTDDDTYGARLAGLLDHAEVLNFGVHGYGTDQMLLRYDREGAAYHLDVVVLAFGWFHMARNMSRFTFFAKPRFVLDANGNLALDGVPVPDPATLLAEQPPMADRLVDQSMALRWAWSRVKLAREREFYERDPAPWRLTEALIRRFVSIARERGARVILLSIDESQPELDSKLSALSAELAVEEVDLGPTMRGLKAAGVEVQLPLDAHWNATGHRVVAERLAEQLGRGATR